MNNLMKLAFQLGYEQAGVDMVKRAQVQSAMAPNTTALVPYRPPAVVSASPSIGGAGAPAGGGFLDKLRGMLPKSKVLRTLSLSGPATALAGAGAVAGVAALKSQKIRNGLKHLIPGYSVWKLHKANKAMEQQQKDFDHQVALREARLGGHEDFLRRLGGGRGLFG